MEFLHRYFNDEKVNLHYSTFGKTNEPDEFHLMFTPDGEGGFEEQLDQIHESFRKLTASNEFGGASVIFKRYFMSDAANQYSFLKEIEGNSGYAVSAVQQPPLNGAKVAVWFYMVKHVTNHCQGNYAVARRNGYEHIWAGQIHGEGFSSFQQTESIFCNLENDLVAEGCNLKENCIRTWLFVHNVDNNYCGVVEARKAFFTDRNMVPQTHYISSTGIEGRNNNPLSLVQADAYSIKGLKKEQVQFLKATTHLNPTYEYGVTFERGTAIHYGDRKQVFISGTASINNKGEIVFPNDVSKQTERAIQNIEALLAEAGSEMRDIASMIIYLRDIADYSKVEKYFQTHYSEIPKVIVLAPVCRPGWLIEIECIAISRQENLQFQNF